MAWKKTVMNYERATLYVRLNILVLSFYLAINSKHSCDKYKDVDVDFLLLIDSHLSAIVLFSVICRLKG